MLIGFLLLLQNKIKNIKKEIVNNDSAGIGIFVAIKLLFLQIVVLVLKTIVIIFESPTRSFQAFANQSTRKKTYVYSFYEHKIFQQRIRLFIMSSVVVVLVSVILFLLLRMAIGDNSPDQDAKIYNVAVKDITKTTAVLKWETTIPSGGYIEYGADINYGKLKEHEDGPIKHTKHAVTLTNLDPNVFYHFRIIEKDKKRNRLFSSEDYTFVTLPFPEITQESIKKITDHVAKISFQTNIPTNALVFYRVLNKEDGVETQGAIKREPFMEKTGQGTLEFHEVMLENLEPNAQYDILIKANDAEGNEVQKQLPSFSLGSDLDAPLIYNFKVENDLVQRSNNLIQTIVSWKTDEPATSQVTYQEGVDVDVIEDKSSSKEVLREISAEDKALTKDHAMVILSLEPNKTYQFRAISRDAEQNEAISRDQIVFTPKQKKTILDILKQSFSDLVELIEKTSK